MKGTWKEAAHQRIARVIAANPGVTDEKELRKLISAAYPFGLRQYHPYKAWCQAVKETFAAPVEHGIKPTYSPADYNSTPLFGGES